MKISKQLPGLVMMVMQIAIVFLWVIITCIRGGGDDLVLYCSLGIIGFSMAIVYSQEIK